MSTTKTLLPATKKIVWTSKILDIVRCFLTGGGAHPPNTDLWQVVEVEEETSEGDSVVTRP